MVWKGKPGWVGWFGWFGTLRIDPRNRKSGAIYMYTPLPSAEGLRSEVRLSDNIARPGAGCRENNSLTLLRIDRHLLLHGRDGLRASGEALPIIADGLF